MSWRTTFGVHRAVPADLDESPLGIDKIEG